MGWRSKCLSQSSRSTLINSVPQGIPNYTMFSFSMLNKVCDKLDALFRRFWFKSKEPEANFLPREQRSWEKLKSVMSLMLCLEDSGGSLRNQKADFLPREQRSMEKLCHPKCTGGGSRKAEGFNNTLLAKLAWMIASKRDSFFFFLIDQERQLML